MNIYQEMKKLCGSQDGTKCSHGGLMSEISFLNAPCGWWQNFMLHLTKMFYVMYGCWAGSGLIFWFDFDFWFLDLVIVLIQDFPTRWHNPPDGTNHISPLCSFQFSYYYFVYTLGWSLSMMRMSYYHCVKLEASGEQCSSTVPLMYLNLKSAVYGLVAASGGSPFYGTRSL